MICRVSPKLPRGRGRDAISGIAVTCGLPVNFTPGHGPEGQQNLARAAGYALVRSIACTTLSHAYRVDGLLMKMHESNPPPKSHNKKIRFSF